MKVVVAAAGVRDRGGTGQVTWPRKPLLPTLETCFFWWRTEGRKGEYGLWCLLKKEVKDSGGADWTKVVVVGTESEEYSCMYVEDQSGGKVTKLKRRVKVD